MLAGGDNPTGTITFTLYNPSGTMVDTETVKVSGDESYTTPTGYTLPTTGTVTGTYQWDRLLWRRQQQQPATDVNDPNEQSVVGAASPAICTTPSAANTQAPRR